MNTTDTDTMLNDGDYWYRFEDTDTDPSDAAIDAMAYELRSRGLRLYPDAVGMLVTTIDSAE